MSDIRIINPIFHKNWDDLILSAEDNSFFLTAAWANVLNDSYGYKPLYFTLMDSRQLKGLIPLMEIKSILTGCRGVSLPFTDYCEPIIHNRHHNLYNAILEYGKKSNWQYIEYRGGEKLLHDNPASANYYRHVLPLTQSKNKLKKKFRSSTRRNINKAIKNNVRIKVSKSAASLLEFYRLHCGTRKIHGIPPQPSHFFKAIYDHVVSKDRGIVLLGYSGRKLIAAAVFLHFGRKAIYKYGASDRNYLNLRANNLIMWEAIQWYAERGYETFCFGRTETENQGLLQFKNGWAAQLKKLHYYKYNLKTDAFEAAKPGVIDFHKKIFQKMPVLLLKAIGATLYRHVG